MLSLHQTEVGEMIECLTCKAELFSVNTCTGGDTVEFADGEILDAVTCADEYCYSCGVTLGKFHHSPCEVQICPSCRDQFISCDCILEGEEME